MPSRKPPQSENPSKPEELRPELKKVTRSKTKVSGNPKEPKPRSRRSPKVVSAAVESQPVTEKVDEEKPASVKESFGISSDTDPLLQTLSINNGLAPRKPWGLILGAAVIGVLAGLLLGYLVWVVPIQRELVKIIGVNASGDSFVTQMKSELSTTKLKQEEMEIRYLAVTDQLESANQYIFLLRMKEQIAVAQYMVDQKEGFKARQTLSEVQNHFFHLKPFIQAKDSIAAGRLEETITTSIQHLLSDPEEIKTDLADISSQLDMIESTLFEPEA